MSANQPDNCLFIVDWKAFQRRRSNFPRLRTLSLLPQEAYPLRRLAGDFCGDNDIKWDYFSTWGITPKP